MTGYRHGFARPDFRDPTYRSWECAKSRCRNPNNPDFRDYGGRGISFSSAWDRFEDFYRDMGPRPRGHTLDRIDCDGDYVAGNCRWSNPSRQSRNRRGVHRLNYRGSLLTLPDLAELTGVPRQRLYERVVRRGWSVERAVQEPARGW